MYSILARYLWSDPLISLIVSRYKTVITILLTVFPMLYFTASWLFCNRQFVGNPIFYKLWANLLQRKTRNLLPALEGFTISVFQGHSYFKRPWKDRVGTSLSVTLLTSCAEVWDTENCLPTPHWTVQPWSPPPNCCTGASWAGLDQHVTEAIIFFTSSWSCITVTNTGYSIYKIILLKRSHKKVNSPLQK